jgi:hypothetical protein
MTTVTKMRLSKETYTILKNFAAINSNLHIKPGNVLKTKSPNSNMLVQAKVVDDFDTDVYIWDLNQFLGIVSMFTNPDLEFNDTYVSVSNGRSSVKYYYAEPNILDVPKKDIKMPATTIKFDLDEKDLNELIRAANILQVSDLKILASDGKIKIMVYDNAQNTANNCEITVDEHYSGDDYEGRLAVSELKFVPGSYTVELTDTIIGRFNHKSLDLSYTIAIER